MLTFAPSRRKALALPVAVLLALGAVGLTAAPASAASDEPPVVVDETVIVDESVVEEVAVEEQPTPEAAPSEEIPVEEIPTEATPADETPIEEIPIENVPVEETPIENAPVEEIPVEEIPFTVLTPIADAPTLNRTVVFTGTGAEGATVTLTDGSGAPVPGTAPVVVTEGLWTLAVTYPDDAATAQTVTATQTAEGLEPTVQTVSFTLPAAGTEAPFAVLTPAPGEVQPARTVVFSGTGTEGSVITLLDANLQPIPGAQPVTVLGGAWLTVATFADDADVIQLVTVRQTNEDAAAEDLVVTVELPSVPPLAAPVITSPAAGEVVTGDRVTFRGTGQPGAFIGLLVVPTALAQDLLDELAAAGDDAAADEAEVMALAAAPAAAPEPANPADPIPVAADGTWSVTLALPAENYTAIAIQALNAEGTVGLSAPSAPVAFSLQPAPVAVPAGTGTTGTPAASGPSRTLAATGGEDISGLAGIGILALIAGAAAIVVGNRRRVTT